jgi:hypothetical protein
MAAVAERLQACPFAELIDIEPRREQVTVSVKPGSLFHAGRLATLVRDLIEQAPVLGVKVVCSAHSVDVIAQDTSKLAVLAAITAVAEGKVLAVGDQGDAEGNDFELLAATRWSVSLDRCSADPSRCWPVDPAGRRGPAALSAMLGVLTKRDGGMVLEVSKISKRRIGARESR